MEGPSLTTGQRVAYGLLILARYAWDRSSSIVSRRADRAALGAWAPRARRIMRQTEAAERVASVLNTLVFLRRGMYRWALTFCMRVILQLMRGLVLAEGNMLPASAECRLKGLQQREMCCAEASCSWGHEHFRSIQSAGGSDKEAAARTQIRVQLFYSCPRHVYAAIRSVERVLGAQLVLQQASRIKQKQPAHL